MTKVPEFFNGERIVSSTNGSGATEYPPTNGSTKYASKIIQLSDDSIKVSFRDFVNGFLTMTSKS